MLVGRTMEDDLRLILGEDLPDAPAVADVRHDRNDVRPHPALAKLPVDLKQRILRLLQQNQPPRAESHALPADFRPDAPPRPGDQNVFPGQESLKLRRIQTDRLSAQKISEIARQSLAISLVLRTITRPFFFMERSESFIGPRRETALKDSGTLRPRQPSRPTPSPILRATAREGDSAEYGNGRNTRYNPPNEANCRLD